MGTDRRAFLEAGFAAAAAALTQSVSKAAPNASPGMPGPFPGRVVAVEHSGCITSAGYQTEPVRAMVERGMKDLTGAPTAQDAWRVLFNKNDVVGIKVSPVGGPKLCSDPSVIHAIFDGLNQAGVPDQQIVVFNRYRQEVVHCGIDKWIRPGMRFAAAAPAYDESQLGIDGYDEKHYMEMAVVKPGDDPNDPRSRRSYVAKIVTTDVNKIINLPVLKHHQSAGVTITLKNMSHGFVNNVNRSHYNSLANSCGNFIPSVVSLPIIRQKVVLHVVDAIRAQYHGGPSGRPQFQWEPRTLYFGTDPVALDKTGWKVIDAKRQEVGMATIEYAKPDKFSTFVHGQVEHIELASSLGLGVFDDRLIEIKNAKLA